MAGVTPQRMDRTETRPSFVERLRDSGDDATWRQFLTRYGRLVHRVAVRAGLRPHEADDVVQETALSVARTMPGFVYEPGRCSFEGWIRRMARLRIMDQLRRRGREVPMEGADGCREEESGSGTGRLPALAMGGGHDEVWEEEWREVILERALERVRLAVPPEHYQIFFLNVLREKSVSDVARILGVTTAQVYVVRHRLLARLRKEVDRARREAGSPAVAKRA